MRDHKTTTIGLVLLALVVICLILVGFGKASLTEAGAFVGVCTGVMSSLGFIMAKDSETEKEEA